MPARAIPDDLMRASDIALELFDFGLQAPVSNHRFRFVAADTYPYAD